jgi:hypothetical protein
LFFHPNWVYIRSKCLWAIAHGFSHGLIQKVRFQEVLWATVQKFSHGLIQKAGFSEVYKPQPKKSSVNHPLVLIKTESSQLLDKSTS